MRLGHYVGFDFDGCLHDHGQPLPHVIAIMREHAEAGDKPIIVTARTASHELPHWYSEHDPDRVLLWPFVERHSLPITGVVFCAHERKLIVLTRLGICQHYDNSRTVVDDCNKSPGSVTKAILIGRIDQ